MSNVRTLMYVSYDAGGTGLPSDSGALPTSGSGSGTGQASSGLDMLQGGMAAAGLIPVVGDFINGANAGISLYRGNYVDAALYGAAAIPLLGTVAEIGEIGKIGETAAGIIKNTERIESLTGTAAYRIPDELNHVEQVIGEVKNVSYQSYTRQLRDSVAYAKKYGYQFRLYVRQGATLSAPLREALEEFGGPIVF